MEKKISFLVSVMWEIKMCVYNLFFLSPHYKESRNLRETKRKMPKRLSLCSLFSFSFLQKCPTFEIASFIPLFGTFSVPFLSPSYPPLPGGKDSTRERYPLRNESLHYTMGFAKVSAPTLAKRRNLL